MLVDKQSNTTSPPLRVNKTVLRFAKDRLPPALSFYEAELGKLTRPNRKGWAMADCPFHKSKSHRSFSVNLERGAFHCFGCDARGGGLIDFVMLRDTCDFKSAATKLGAWDDAGQSTPPPVMVPISYLTFDFSIGVDRYSASVRDEPRSYAGVIRNFRREASDQLTSLGVAKAESADAETCWTRLALATFELRELGI